MDEMEMLFSLLNEEEADMLLSSIEEPCDPELSRKIKQRMGIKDKKAEIRAFPVKKILPFAAVLCVVLICAVAFAVKGRMPHTVQPTQPPSTTQAAPAENPLMAAISTGDEDIIQKLLSVPGVITRETMDFALNLSNRLSYNTLHQIAVSVRESLGSTGLDTLVESALLGDSQKALQELKTREEMTMTPFEKLAFFFAVAFCDREVVEEFVARGYDINIKDASGNSIYAIAEKYGNEDTKQFAVSQGITS